MLRQYTESKPGWWLITHPDHARLAGEFATAWGNALFISPEPRRDVLQGISCHDDGWAKRDAAPEVTREGKPSAFSTELVGKYSAFEEIDLEAYLAVRQRALEVIASVNPYAAILISKHTYNLLGSHADRSTIAPDDLPKLDAFLESQLAQQQKLREQLVEAGKHSPEDLRWETFEKHFRLLQACDNLSLLSCVNHQSLNSLLHPLPAVGGDREVAVRSAGPRHFVLEPWPFKVDELKFQISARWVAGETFESHEALRKAFHAAESEPLPIRLSKG